MKADILPLLTGLFYFIYLLDLYAILLNKAQDCLQRESKLTYKARYKASEQETKAGETK